MGLTETTRLKLAKYVTGDPNWAAGLNAGMDNADARILLVGSASPVAVADGHYIGQLYYQTGTSPPTVWICTGAGAPGTWIQLSQLPLGAIINYNTALRAKESGGTERELLKLSGNERILLGSGANPLRLVADSATGTLDAAVAGGSIVTIVHTGNLATLIDPLVPNLPARSFTKLASDFNVALGEATEKIIPDYNRLDFPGVKDGSNKYILRARITAAETNTAASYLQIRMKVGSTGDGLTDNTVDFVRLYIGNSHLYQSMYLCAEVTPAANDRVSLTSQKETNHSYRIYGGYTHLEILEVLD